MIDKILSTTSNQCYLGNKYLLRAYICCFQPLVGCIMACNSLLATVVFLVKFISKHPYRQCEQVEMSAYVGNYINHIIGSLNPTYVNEAILLLIISSKCSHVQYGCICKPLAFHVILVAFLKVSQLSSVPFLLVVMSLMLCV